MWPPLLYAGMCLLAALAAWRAEAGAVVRKRRRLAGDPDIVELPVRVEADSRQAVSIGSSVESPEAVSGTPTLDADAVVVVEQPFLGDDGPAPPYSRAGRRLRLRAGVPLKIEKLPGARRNTLDIETTESGVRHRYSFELRPETRLWISGSLVRPETGGPFRDEATWELAPLAHDAAKGSYLASATRGAVERAVDALTGGAFVWFGFATLVFAVSFIPYVGPVLLGIGLTFILLVACIEWRSLRDAAVVPAAGAATGRSSSPRLRVDAGAATHTDIEGDTEVEAAEAAPRATRGSAPDP